MVIVATALAVRVATVGVSQRRWLWPLCNARACTWQLNRRVSAVVGMLEVAMVVGLMAGVTAAAAAA